MVWTVDRFRSDMLYFLTWFGHVPVKESFAFLMIFQFFCSLFVVTRFDVDGCLNLAPSDIGYHVHLVDHSTRVGVLLFAVVHRAGESQSAGSGCPRLPHSVDSRFGLYHVAVVLRFLRSPISLADI